MIAFITGGARGIGRQIAADLASAGYSVVIGDLDEGAVTRAASSLGDRVTGVVLDVTDCRSLAEAIETVETTIGPIDVWVNNAGIMPTGRFGSEDASLARETIAVDYAALVEATSAILPLMLSRGTGTIVNMSSATALKPLAGLAVYSGAKAAVSAFSEALRREVRGTGVRIRVVQPYLADTAMSAGISSPALFPAVSVEQVSRSVLQSIRSGPFMVTVPRRIGPLLRALGVLPVWLRDWIDDRISIDQIGLGGEETARAAYLDEVRANQRPPSV